MSVKVANAVADAFVLEIANLTGQDDIQILDRATGSVMCYNAISAKFKTIFIFVFVGTLLTCLFIAARETLSLKMYTPDDATSYGQLDILGVIPEFNHKKDI